jgi:uncharacterized protein (TIGR03083 family)
MRLAGEAYERFVGLVRTLDTADWARATDCSGWDVRALAGHVLGSMQMAASIPGMLAQTRAAKRRGGLFIDALTAHQVEKNAGLAADELVRGLAETAPKALRGRRRVPSLIRERTIPDEQSVDGAQFERWTFGYLLDVILTRDTWMHRIDLARAVGALPQLTPDHDGVLVADVAAEWAQRHGQPCTLTLTGPAGGAWSWGTGGPAVEADAVEFCRALSGRDGGTGLLATRVPF